MKKHFLTPLFLVSFLFLTMQSCSKGDDAPTPAPATIFGNWKLESSTVNNQTTNLTSENWFYAFFGQNTMKETKGTIYVRDETYMVQNTILTITSRFPTLSGDTIIIEDKYTIDELSNSRLVIKLFSEKYTSYSYTGTTFYTDSQKETKVLIRQ